MKFAKKLMLIVLTFFMPVIIICVLTGREFNLNSLIDGINQIEIVEDYRELKLFLEWFEFDTSEGLLEPIKQVFNLIKKVVELFVVSPIKSIIDIYNLLFV